MVSTRCKLMVENEFEKIGLPNAVVDLGEVVIKEPLSTLQKQQLGIALKRIGLELIEDRRSILVEKIKHVVIKAIHFTDKVLRINFSEHLSKTLQYNYKYLANVFSKTTGSTIENLIISHKIERAKEFIIYDELTLTEIAYNLNYSSVAHLSNQFKKVTGLTPTSFKNLQQKRRRTLEEI